MKIEEIPPIENVELEVKIAYGKINQLVDLVNSQQEAIEKLDKVITRDIVRVATDDIIDALSGSEEPIEMVSKARYAEKLGIHDTHRTVTLRIPKGMTVGEAISEAFKDSDYYVYIGDLDDNILQDTDLQKALDEVQPNE